jgi:hypothetical protein
MPKVLLSILACLYLLSTSGMQVQHHYCMGHFRSSHIGFHQPATCGTCGMEAGHSQCCHDESQWLKVKDNHQAAAMGGEVPAPFVLMLPPVLHYQIQQPVVALVAGSVSNHSPPFLLLDRTVRYRVFRI